jgi:predicted secreted hydrolase
MLCAVILLLAVLPLPARADDYLPVTGPCNFEFPAEHGAHPGYRTEWWYYTGNLRSREGRRFGFQLTFFRSQISPPGAEKNWPHPSSAWRTQQVFLGHAAVSDIDGRRHLQAEQAARGTLDLAGVNREGDLIRVFLKDWEARIEPHTQQLRADTDAFGFDLALAPEKPPVSHGNAGYSLKGSTAERASCYYSFTRLSTRGTISIGDSRYSVEGLSWMDHEYSTAPLEPGLTGWDWFGLQLSDQSEIMMYLLRQRGGGLGTASSGSYVDANAQVRRVARTDFEVQVLDTWKSPHSGAVYPAKWRVSIAPLALEISISPNLADQEMRASGSEGVTYWEGSVSLRGIKAGRAVEGSGYVELTGYARPFDALK